MHLNVLGTGGGYAPEHTALGQVGPVLPGAGWIHADWDRPDLYLLGQYGPELTGLGQAVLTGVGGICADLDWLDLTF